MDEIITDFDESMLIKVSEENFWEFWRLIGNSHTSEVQETPEMLRYMTQVPVAHFNGVLRTRLKPEEIDMKIEEVKAKFKALQKSYIWGVEPSSEPSTIAEVLEKHGFMKMAEFPNMTVDITSLDEKKLKMPKGFTIEYVDNEEKLKKQIQALVKCIENPPQEIIEKFYELEESLGYDKYPKYQRFVGLINGEPVATSVLLLAAGVAGIYSVNTAINHRRKGIGAAMTMKPLILARDMGYRIGILQSTPMALSMYQKLGFKENYKLIWYTEQPDEMLEEYAAER